MGFLWNTHLIKCLAPLHNRTGHAWAEQAQRCSSPLPLDSDLLLPEFTTPYTESGPWHTPTVSMWNDWTDLPHQESTAPAYVYFIVVGAADNTNNHNHHIRSARLGAMCVVRSSLLTLLVPFVGLWRLTYLVLKIILLFSSFQWLNSSCFQE